MVWHLLNDILPHFEKITNCLIERGERLIGYWVGAKRSIFSFLFNFYIFTRKRQEGEKERSLIMATVTENTAKNLKLSTPWVTLKEQMLELFGYDPDIRVVDEGYGAGDSQVKQIKLMVDGPVKADALTQILPESMNFGGVEVKITVVPANDGEQSIGSLYRAAFNGNPAVHDILTVKDFTGTDVTYVEFAKKIVQFCNDNIGSPAGVSSMLYEDIARDVLGDKNLGVFFSTTTVNRGDDISEDF